MNKPKVFDLSNDKDYHDYCELLADWSNEPEDVDPSDWNSFDYDGEDIGTVTVNEMRLQNGDY